MFQKLFGNVNEYKVSKFEAHTEGILVHSIQLKRETCKFVTTPSHYRVCVSARTYYL